MCTQVVHLVVVYMHVEIEFHLFMFPFVSIYNVHVYILRMYVVYTHIHALSFPISKSRGEISLTILNFSKQLQATNSTTAITTMTDGWVGRLEDRRTASNADPYKVAAAIIKTTKEALA